MTVKRRIFIRVISYFVALCMIFAVSGIFSQRAKAGYEETLGKVRMTNLGSMCEYFRDISAGLRLLAVSADSSVAESISYVEARVMGAKGCLNGFNAKKMKNIGDFLDAATNFTQNFSGTSEKRKIAIYLSEYAQEVYFHLNDVSAAILNGAYSLTEYGSIYRNDELPYFEDFVDYSNGNEKELFKAAAPASAIDNGPYFDKKEDISEEEAMNIASRATGIDAALWRDNSRNSSHGAYSFSHGDIAVEVSKSGMLCRLINPRPCKTAEISVDEAEKTAEEYLVNLGYKNAVAVKRENSEFTASFLFYPEANDVLLMTAPIEIEICKSSGATVFLNACEYIKNFRNNIVPPEKMPDIKPVLPENAVLHQTFFCLTKIGKEEKICVLAMCRYDNYNFYFYIDPHSMRIVKTENA